MAKRFIRAFIPLIALALIPSSCSWAENVNEPKGDAPYWSCNSEDEVVVIDNSCKHIDELVEGK